MKGKIIVIDGMDGTGKHTQSKLLEAELGNRGIKVYRKSFPSYDDDSSYFVKKWLNKEYDNLNFTPYQLSLLYSIDRIISYLKDIKSKYEDGYTIIFDRYYISNVIYNIHNLSNDIDILSFMKFIYNTEVLKGGLPKPDHTIILASNPTISDKLIDERYNGDDSKRDKNENIEFQSIIHDNINKIPLIYNYEQYLGNLSIINIDSKNRLLPIKDIHNKILEEIDYVYK